MSLFDPVRTMLSHASAGGATPLHMLPIMNLVGFNYGLRTTPVRVEAVVANLEKAKMTAAEAAELADGLQVVATELRGTKMFTRNKVADMLEAKVGEIRALDWPVDLAMTDDPAGKVPAAHVVDAAGANGKGGDHTTSPT